MTNAIDIKAAETTFFRSLGNGKQSVKALADMVHHAIANGGDTTRLGNMVNRIAKEKSDANAIRAITVTVGAIWKGAKKNTAKNGAVTFKIKGATIDPEAIARMDDCAKRDLSLRDTYIKAIRGTVERAKREDAAVCKAGIKAAKVNGMDKAKFLAMCEALWNDVSV